MPPDRSTELRLLGLPIGLHAPLPDGPGVDVYLCHLSPGGSGEPAPDSPLSADEMQLASRFVFAEHRRRFIQRHTALREVLGRHCGIAPAQLELACGRHGRPCLRNANPPLDFNLSHAGDWAVIAVSSDGWVGIDVAAPDGTGWQDLVASTLTPTEQHQLAATPAPLRAGQFFAHWTAKEAFMKLNGLGLGIAPGSIEVGPGGVVASHLTGLAVRRAAWTRIETGADLICTLATAVPPRALGLSRWPEARDQPSLRVSLPSACVSLR
jgi:4'-phosphopantetheinyl transferase